MCLAVHFLRMILSVIIAIRNRNGDSASPWNSPLWIFPSVKLSPPAVNITLRFQMVFLDNLYDFVGYYNSF